MKLIATDLDGTLLNSKSSISKENILAILEAQDLGVDVVVSTGRTFNDAKHILKNAGIHIPYIISCNGSLIHNIEGEKLNSFPITKTVLKRILPFLHLNNFFYSISTDKYMLEPSNAYERLISDFYNAKGANPNLPEKELDNLLNFFSSNTNVEIRNFDDINDIYDLEDEIFNLTIISFDINKLNFGKSALRDIDDISIVSSNTNNFEIVSNLSSKGNAVELLAKRMNISLKDTMAIGDNFNDLSMLEKVKYSVAMGNANKQIQEKCNFVTLKNDDNGVAYAIKEHLKNLA